MGCPTSCWSCAHAIALTSTLPGQAKRGLVSAICLGGATAGTGLGLVVSGLLRAVMTSYVVHAHAAHAAVQPHVRVRASVPSSPNGVGACRSGAACSSVSLAIS